MKFKIEAVLKFQNKDRPQRLYVDYAIGEIYTVEKRDWLFRKKSHIQTHWFQNGVLLLSSTHNHSEDVHEKNVEKYLTFPDAIKNELKERVVDDIMKQYKYLMKKSVDPRYALIKKINEQGLNFEIEIDKIKREKQ